MGIQWVVHTTLQLMTSALREKETDSRAALQLHKYDMKSALFH